MHVQFWCKTNYILDFKLHSNLLSSCLHHRWSWNRQSVPKRRHIKFRRRRITQKKEYNELRCLYHRLGKGNCIAYVCSLHIFLCNVMHRVYLSQYLTNLMHEICFTISFISWLYMFRAHVEVRISLHSTSGGQNCITQYLFRAHVLIISRSKLHYTASGITTPIGVVIPEAV